MVVLTEQEALDALYKAGRIEAASIAALGEGWNWERSRTSKAVIRWERADRIEREPGTGRKIVIRIREGAGNGNTGTGTILGHKRKAGTGGTASTGKRKTGPNRTGNGTGPVREHKAGTNGTTSTGNGNGTAVHGSVAVHGPAVPDSVPAIVHAPAGVPV
jgi:hypothetical protein